MLFAHCSGSTAADPRGKAADGEREPCVDQDNGAKRDEAGDSLTKQAVDLSGVREAQP